jgi:hypothetical protein
MPHVEAPPTDMTNLDVVRLNNAFYITSREKAARLALATKKAE